MAPPQEDSSSHIFVFFHRAGRKLFRVMDSSESPLHDGDAPHFHEDVIMGPPKTAPLDTDSFNSYNSYRDVVENDNDHYYNHHGATHGHKEHHKEDHKEHHKPCGFGGPKELSFYPNTSPEYNSCIQDLVSNESVNLDCRIAINNAIVVNDQLNYVQAMEQYQAAAAGLLAFFLIMMFIGGVVAFAFAPRARKLQAQRQLRLSILNAVYEDPELKEAVEKKLDCELGDVVPIRSNLKDGLAEPTGFCCCLRTLIRGVIYAFLIAIVLSSPFLSFLAFWIMLAKGIRYCCRKRSFRNTDVAGTEYPGSVNPVVEMKQKEAQVYVGIPTTVV
jgi:hypothetical protein